VTSRITTRIGDDLRLRAISAGDDKVTETWLRPVATRLEMCRGKRAVDQHRLTRTDLAEQMERGERLAVRRLRDTAPPAASTDVGGQGSMLDLFVTEQP
jgi:hypothetical protein